MNSIKKRQKKVSLRMTNVVRLFNRAEPSLYVAIEPQTKVMMQGAYCEKPELAKTPVRPKKGKKFHN